MLKKRVLFRRGLPVLVAVILSGCASGQGHGPQHTATAENPGIGRQDASLSKGRGYFMRECTRCHRAFYPEERKASEWAGILARKKTKVSLSAEQYAQLTEYVIGSSRRQEEKGP